MESYSVKQTRDNLVKVNMTISRGKWFSLIHALENSDGAVAKDLLMFLQKTANDNNVEM